MTDGKPITPEQALVAAEAAGLDLNRPLAEQVKGATVDREALREIVREELARQAEQTEADPPEPGAAAPHTREHVGRELEAGRAMLEAIEQSRQSRWYGGGDDAA